MDYMQKAITAIGDLDSRIQVKFRELDDELLWIKQRGIAMPTPASFGSSRGSMGAKVAKAFSENSDSFNKNRTLTLQVKDITSSVVGAVAHEGPTNRPDPLRTSIVSALSMRPIGGLASLVYLRMTDAGLNGAVQNGEGATKTQITPVFTPITQNAITIAGYTVMTEQALKNSGELESVIDVHLKQAVMKGLEEVLVDGTTVVAWPFQGLEALATGYTSATYTSLHDAIIESAAHMRWVGYEPNVVCLNPMSFLGIALAKDTAGQYLAASYMNDLPTTLHGMRVTFSGGVTLGKALVIDSRYVETLVSDDLNVTFAYVADDFIKNKVTARGEMSVIPVLRDTGAVHLVTPAP